MRLVKAPFLALKHVATSRRWQIGIALVAGLVLFGSRARTVVSAAPRVVRNTVQQPGQQPPPAPSQPGSDAAPAGAGTGTDMLVSERAAARQTMVEPGSSGEGSGAEAAQPAGEDDTGTFRPARATTDDFGVVVTDEEPAGLEGAANWVEGTGTSECPDDFPIKGNANSRIYHKPGESSYARTIPGYCFASEDDAVAAGYRPRAGS